MVGRPCADPEQKQDFGDRTVTQGLDTQWPITEALQLRNQFWLGGNDLTGILDRAD